MSAKVFYKILAILLGYGLIIGGFIVFGESLEDRVKILDIVVSCLIFTQLVQFMLFPLIDLGKAAHREIGMMGIHFATLISCCVLFLALMTCGIVFQIPFKFQLMGQLIVLFILWFYLITLYRKRNSLSFEAQIYRIWPNHRLSSLSISARKRIIHK